MSDEKTPDEQLRDTVSRHDQLIMGYWDTTDGRTVRVPGLLEQAAAQSQDTKNIMTQMKKREDDEQHARDDMRKAMWSIGKPILVFLAFMFIVEIARWIVEANPALVKEVLHQ